LDLSVGKIIICISFKRSKSLSREIRKQEIQKMRGEMIQARNMLGN
jgi:hypothetical protein